MDNTSCYNLNKENLLREITVKIGLERINMQEGITVEALLDSSTTGLVMSLEFARKQDFKLKKIEKPIYIRNVNGSLNKKGLIKHTVEVNIYYQGHRERTEIDMIGGQKWSMILEIPWLACHNSEIDWKTREVKIIRYSEECEAIEIKAGKIRVAKTKEERSRRESKKKARAKGKKEKTEKGKNNEYKRSSREIGNLRERRRNSKVGGKSKKASPRKVPLVDKSLVKNSQRECQQGKSRIILLI